MTRVQDLMSNSVETVPPAMAADQAWTVMRLKRIHHLIVTDERSIVGVVSERDLGGRQGAPVRANRTVADLMTSSVITLPPATPVRKAANVMRGHSIGCVVVVRGEKPVGIITTADLLEALGRGSERPVAATTRWTLKHVTPHRKRNRSAGVW